MELSSEADKECRKELAYIWDLLTTNPTEISLNGFVKLNHSLILGVSAKSMGIGDAIMENVNVNLFQTFGQICTIFIVLMQLEKN